MTIEPWNNLEKYMAESLGMLKNHKESQLKRIFRSS